jgi:pimeloyl-ACP methyl ester carboxylesterase
MIPVFAAAGHRVVAPDLLGFGRSDKPADEGAALSRRAREWWRTEWAGRTFMAIGMKDPVLGPPVMRAMARIIRGCPPPFEIAEGGHFVPEWGEPIARAALEAL